jgi:hypothetical protein
MSESLFDLNIGEFLDAWTPADAVREILANALDESLLTDTAPPTVERVTDGWVIRDQGRGLEANHLRQTENDEKTTSALPVIGRFGVGLKDALATLERHGVTVEIVSRHGRFTLEQRDKNGFPGMVTLHARIGPAPADAPPGTAVWLRGLRDVDMDDAKSMFLHFTEAPELERTAAGAILARPSTGSAAVYVRGLRVASEPDFLFSYDVTQLSKGMADALNRERQNVGRNAYRSRIRGLLLKSNSDAVAEALGRDLARVAQGNAHDEVSGWIDVAVHACRILNAGSRPTVFVDSNELQRQVEAVDRARDDGYRVVPIPGNVAAKLRGKRDLEGNPVRTLAVLNREWRESFRFAFVETADLTPAEHRIWGMQDVIADALGGLPNAVEQVRVSETMRPDTRAHDRVLGLWEPGSGTIIIKRSELRDPASFAGVLAHEIAHAASGFPDVSRDFENTLTEMLGQVLADRLR